MQTKNKNFKENKKEFWEKEDYGQWFLNRKGFFIDIIEKKALLSMVQNNIYESALDVGIGNGRLLSIYGNKCNSIVGFDLSSNLLKQASTFARKKNIKFESKVGDAEMLPFPDNSFDLVISSRMLQHSSDWKKCISEMSRVCKTGGKIVLMIYNSHSAYGIFRNLKIKVKSFISQVGRLFNLSSKKLYFGNFISYNQISREFSKHKIEEEAVRGAGFFPIDLFPTKLVKDIQVIFRFGIKFESLSLFSPYKYCSGRLLIKGISRKE